MLLRVKTFKKDFVCWCFSLYDHLCTLYPALLTHHHSFHILLYFHLVMANQIPNTKLSSAVQTKQCTDVRSQICTMTPFQGATVVTLKTITPLSSLRGVITESDAPAEFEEIRVGGLQFYCLLRKVVKQKTSIKDGCGTNVVRTAARLADKCSLRQLWPVKHR